MLKNTAIHILKSRLKIFKIMLRCCLKIQETTPEDAWIEEIKAEWKMVLMDVPERDYLSCLKDWKKRWHKCILKRGDFLKGQEIKLKE